MSIQQGAEAEEIACRYLLTQGFCLIERNYHSRFGEIDLIVAQGNTIIFVEVRQRRSRCFGGAAVSVTWKKQQKIQRSAAYFLQMYPKYQTFACRFDVIALDGPELKLNWIKNAFGQN